jgi:hypothetical protein
VIGIMPGRLATRQRLIVGALLVAIVSTLNLIAADLWAGFGSPWPIALLWAVCGWSKLGANLATAILIFLLGCWIDLLTGSVLGTWALTGLATLGMILLGETLLGIRGLSPFASCGLAGACMILVISLLGFWHNQQIQLQANLVAIGGSVLIYQIVYKLFVLVEDET